MIDDIRQQAEDALGAVLSHSMARGSDKVILLGIALYQSQSEDGWASLTLAQISEFSKVHARSARRSIRAVAESGELLVETNGGEPIGPNATEHHRPNRYRSIVACPEWCDGAPGHGGRPVATNSGRRASASTRRHLRVHAIAERDGWWCRYCGVALVDTCSADDTVTDDYGKRIIRPGLGKEVPTIDHVIPVAMGGSGSLDNLVLACQGCNSRKQAG